MTSDSIFQARDRHVLNGLLGREANIRILRYLSEVSEPVGISDTAKAVGLTVSGASRALVSLVETGFIEQTGSGRQRQYSYRKDDELLEVLSTLFTKERIRYEKLTHALRDKIQQLPDPPTSAWIEHRQNDDSTVIHLGFYSGSEHVDTHLGELRKNLYDLERRFDHTIEIHGYTKADMDQVDVSNTSLLVGLPIEYPQMIGAMTGSHKSHDERARLRARTVSDIVREDPAILSKAKAHIEKLLRADQGAARLDLVEWKQILDSYSKRRLLNFLISDSERAQRLRQSSPLMAVLDEAQKRKLLLAEQVGIE